MAPESRRSHAAVIERLEKSPHGFDFFQAVRLLEQDARDRRLARTDEERAEPDSTSTVSPTYPDEIGADGKPSDEAARFRVVPSLSFPVAPIAELRRSDSRAGTEAATLPCQVAVTFIGLIGPNGALPAYYTELVQQRLQLRDRSLRDFLDTLHHRTISLFFRAWRKHRFYVEYEYTRLTGAFSGALASFVGLGMRSLRARQAISDESALHYAGQLANLRRSAAGLECVLRDYFRLDIAVEQFVGRWLTVPESDRSRLGAREDGRSELGQLGAGISLGSRVWDIQSKVRVHAGPMRYDEFAEMLAPKRPGQRRFHDLVRFYLGLEFDFDLVVHLKPGTAPPLRLGGAPATGARLGENTWMSSTPSVSNTAPAVFAM